MEKLLDELETLLKQVDEKAIEIMGKAEDLKCDLDALQEQYDDFKDYVNDNYKHKTQAEQYEISDDDFI